MWTFLNLDVGIGSFLSTRMNPPEIIYRILNVLSPYSLIRENHSVFIFPDMIKKPSLKYIHGYNKDNHIPPDNANLPILWLDNPIETIFQNHF